MLADCVTPVDWNGQVSNLLEAVRGSETVQTHPRSKSFDRKYTTPAMREPATQIITVDEKVVQHSSFITVLTATFNSYGNIQISTPYKISTPEPIEKKFGTVDYVREGTPYTKFGRNQPTEGFCANG